MVETTDLWQTAYLLAEGHFLERIKVKKWGEKRELLFIFDGSAADELSNRFRAGHASCNVAKLRRSMNGLKDIIFSGGNRR
jgi:hypothetical protein